MAPVLCVTCAARAHPYLALTCTKGPSLPAPHLSHSTCSGQWGVCRRHRQRLEMRSTAGLLPPPRTPPGEELPSDVGPGETDASQSPHTGRETQGLKQSRPQSSHLDA